MSGGQQYVIPCFCDSWTADQKLNVAALSSYAVNTLSWSNNVRERIFKRAFMTGIFQHLGIEDENERKRFFVNTRVQDVEIIINSLKVQVDNDEKDMRSEILMDLLLFCLGLSPKILERVEKKETSSLNPINMMRDKLGKITNVVGDAVGVDRDSTVSTEVSSPHHMKPAEYDARARAIFFKVAHLLDFTPERPFEFENTMAQQLYLIQKKHEDETDSIHVHEKLQDAANETLEKHDKRKKMWRWMATGVGVVVGATAIGITGGIAAPFIAFGLSAITGGIAFGASSIVLITGLFGVYGGGLAGYKMNKRTRGLKEFSFTHIGGGPTLQPIPSLYLNIVISGYLLDSYDEVTAPWLPSFQNSTVNHDTFALTFDPEILRDLGKAFRQFIAETAVKVAAYEVLKHTVLGVITTALALPAGVAKAGDLIDNPWVLGADRARKAGLVLADVLIERVQGKRPTVLIGYSLGTLVIWECLKELARREEYGLIDSVILIGAPIPAEPIDEWKLASSVVSRRFVNAYATNDLVIAVLYRIHITTTLDLNRLTPAGLEAVKFEKIENYDVTKYTSGHLGYCKSETMTQILQEIGLER